MPVGDILYKQASGTPLTEEEKGDLRLWGNRTETNNDYVVGIQNGQSTINAQIVNAQSGDFEIPPARGIALFGTATADQSTHTPVAWTTVFNKSNTSRFVLDPTDNTKLNLVPGAQGSTIAAVGSVNWGGSKACAVRIEQFDSSNNSILIATYSMASYTAIVQAFAGFFTIDTEAVYIKLMIFQSTTAPNALGGANLAMFEII